MRKPDAALISVESAQVKQAAAARPVPARELLRESACSVTEIAARVGYPTIHAFSRAFKRLVGMSQGAYSRSVR